MRAVAVPATGGTVVTRTDESGTTVVRASGAELVGRLEEVADVIRFLTSPAARYVTGQAIAVDGGPTVKMRA